jgi:hypothetical protein
MDFLPFPICNPSNADIPQKNKGRLLAAQCFAED